MNYDAPVPNAVVIASSVLKNVSAEEFVFYAFFVRSEILGLWGADWRTNLNSPITLFQISRQPSVLAQTTWQDGRLIVDLLEPYIPIDNPILVTKFGRIRAQESPKALCLPPPARRGSPGIHPQQLAIKLELINSANNNRLFPIRLSRPRQTVLKNMATRPVPAFEAVQRATRDLSMYPVQ